MGKPLHILSLEDDLDNSELIAVMLRTFGYRVTSTPTIMEAMKLIEGHTYDLFLLDRQLPDGDGIDLCKKIREKDPETPIVFFSAYAYDRDIEQGLAAGVQVYLTKPGFVDELEETIGRLIGRRETEIQ